MFDRTQILGKVTLIRLVDAGLTVANPAEDVRERRVIGAAGEDVGRVDAIFVDPRRQRVRYLRVAAGGIFGFGTRCVLIPCSAVVRVTRDAVDVGRRCQTGRLGYDPVLTAERHWGDSHLLSWAPFWARPLLDPVLAAPTSPVGAPAMAGHVGGGSTPPKPGVRGASPGASGARRDP
jgi:sporulation protein YlmC with PRC-barrel domain